MNTYCPFVEKHRPKKFENIVLDPLNKKILKNVIETSYFPNLLFYGPPGTGKTTTIINLVDAYQEKLGNKNKGLMIHLNASDERGIDIIRNQINLFVNSKPLFNEGMKFVILDEVDYMTKNAQQALRYLLQNYSSSVRFCLICNYISRIDDGLQNEFLKLRFNQLPKEDIIGFLKKISVSEKLNISDKCLYSIQKLYNSDIRSMINFMQSNQDILNDANYYIIDEEIWKNLFEKIKVEPSNKIIIELEGISKKYNIDSKNIIKAFLNYIIRNIPQVVTSKFLSFVENIMHFQDCKTSHYVCYCVEKLSLLLKDNTAILA
jgi:DNA polymerase III delta prime subunit